MTSSDKRVIYPGSTLGMVGGGQLGRMFALAASSMGYRVAVYCHDENEPAAQVAHRRFLGPIDDLNSAAEFATACDVVSLEFENIPVATMRTCQRHAPVRPGPELLRVAQDRGIEKRTLRDAGVPVTPFEIVADAPSASQFADRHQWPIIVKTCRSGYDGRGQHRVESATDLDRVAFGSTDADGNMIEWIAEKFIRFECEVSVVVARSALGEVTTFALFQNGHRNHILDVTEVPAAVKPNVHAKCDAIARQIADHLQLEGVLCVEFFVVDNEPVVNEIAPRPHNSGHVTIEACRTSQFEQQVRAICNLPLGDPSLRVPAAGMLNLVGHDDHPPSSDRWKQWCDPAANLHWYGKGHCRKGRKMGHITMTGQTADEVRQALERLRWVAGEKGEP